MRSLVHTVWVVGAIAILAACGTPQIVIDQRAEIDSLNIAYASLQDTLTFYESIDSGSYYRELRVRDMRINELEYQLSIKSDDRILMASELVDDLFSPASADLLEAGKVRVDSLASMLNRIPLEQVIRIEAHADNIPPGLSLRERYPSNWELSAARAAAVARYLIETHGLSISRFEVISFGDAHPVATNGTPRGGN